MNAAAANALFEAERKGVKQSRLGIPPVFGDGCAITIIQKADLLTSGWSLDEQVCTLCGYRLPNEIRLVAHLNDDHDLTFGEIARKCGPDHV